MPVVGWISESSRKPVLVSTTCVIISAPRQVDRREVGCRVVLILTDSTAVAMRNRANTPFLLFSYFRWAIVFARAHQPRPPVCTNHNFMLMLVSFFDG